MELAQVMQALRNADAAGDVNAARRLAQIAQGMMGQPQQPQSLLGPKDYSKMTTAELEAAPSASTSLSDIGRSFGTGLIGGAKTVADVFGAGNDVSNYLGQKAQEMQAGISPERQAEIARRQELEKRAAASGSLLQEAKTFLGGVAEAPLQSVAQALGTSAPTLAASLGAVFVAPQGAIGLGVARLGQIAIGAAQGVGEYKGSVHEEVKKAYLEKGYKPAEAEALAIKAQEYTMDKAFEIGGSGLLGALDAFTGIESGVKRAIQKAGKGKLGKEGIEAGIKALPDQAVSAPSLGIAAIRSMAGEAPLEGLQGGFGQLAQNLALQREGLLEGDVTQGVLGAAVRDAAVGALTGGAFTPVQMSEMRSDYNLDQFLRQQKQQQEFDAELGKALAEAKTKAPEAEISELPGGYQIATQEVGQYQAPVEHYVMEEGSDTPLATVKTEAEVAPKIERLNAIREQEAEKALQQINKINEGLQKQEQSVEVLEATGQSNTPQYAAAVQKLEQDKEAAVPQIEGLMNQVQSLKRNLVYMPGEVQTQTQNQYNLTKDGEVVGTFSTPQEAENMVRQTVGEDVFKQHEEQRQQQQQQAYDADQIAALKVTLESKLRQFGLENVGVEIVKQLENGAGGKYLNRLVSIALDETAPIQTMRHESVHALKDLGFFTPQQWSVLQNMARNKWINEYLANQQTEIDGQQMSRLEGYRKLGLTEDEIIEEAIADAFGAFDLNKPPPGMLAALHAKLKKFFEALKNGFTGAGFQTAESVFGKIERGELKSSKTQPSGQTKYSVKRPAVEDEVEISTQNPSGKTRKYDPLTQMLSIDEKAVLELMDINPRYRKETIDAIRSYGFIPNDTSDKDAIRVFKDNIVNNLLFLYKAVPEDTRNRSKLWYDGANKIAIQMADKYGLSMPQVSAIMAAMSPQKDWFQNVSMGERAIDILTERGNMAWTPDMLRYAKSYVMEADKRKEREKREEQFERIKRVAEKGTVLNDMDEESAAAFIRAYDESFNSRQYRIVTPEGGFGDLVRNNDGTPSTMMWSTYGPIEKAVSIFRDGSRKNISEQLGFEHKIRSFYNNIAAPNSDLEHVTIDTHAVAAALFESLAGTDPEVVQNFGGTGKSDIIGVGGTYGLIADAYREAANKVGILPREMQSITWEAVRGLFSEEFKNAIKLPVKAEWQKYKNGEQTFEQARQKIIDISKQKRSAEKNVDIPAPDWMGTDDGQFVEDGGESYDKSYIPEGGVRLRQEKLIRENITFNLSAVTNSIPGLKELYARALKMDENAIKVLQTVAESSLKHLLSGTNARVKIERASGVYMSDREPSLMVSATFSEAESKQVLAALARFAKNFNQQQIHVRMPTNNKLGFEYDDGSYVTPVYTIALEKALSAKRISEIIEKTGLQGFTVTQDSLIAYYVKPERKEGESNGEYQQRAKEAFGSFKEAAIAAHGLAGRSGEKPKQTNQRLFVYGSGEGAAIDYESISGDVRPKQGSDSVTPRVIAEYLTKQPVQTFKPKPLNKSQVKEQKELAKDFDNLPINDLKNPLVKKAYRALIKALKEQFAVIPVKVEIQTSKFKKGDEIPEGFEIGDLVPPYGNLSNLMRKDIIDRNHLLIYPTTPETFGPKGYDFSKHPLLEDSGFKDQNGKPLLWNDVLRTVHDYFAHGLTDAAFGPIGEFTAWRNHMASTNDPLARWALTAETRMQNAWQNFREGVENIPLKDRPFSLQKAALPPAKFLFTGDEAVDAPVKEMLAELSEEQQQGSPKVKKPVGKLSLKNISTPQFKQWFGDSTVVNRDGTPKVMYHGLAKDTTDFTRKTERGAPIFLTDDPDFAARFAVDSYLQVASHPQKYLTQAQMAEGEKKAISAIRKDYGKDSLGKEMIESIREGAPTAEAREYLQKEYVNMLPSGPHIMPLYVRAERPFDYENPAHIKRLKEEIELDPDTWNDIRGGSWESIEASEIQEAIQMAGFDSFYVKEHGRKNLAVYDPNQVKSATGNTGEYSRVNNDVRYSLKKVSFATPEEALKAVKEAGIPDTPEFKKFIHLTQVATPSGKPMVMYHGSSRDFFEFQPAGLSQAIFLSEEPKNAQKYAVADQERLRQMAYRALTKEQRIELIERVADRAVEDGDIDEGEANEIIRKARRYPPAYGSFGAIEKNVMKELADLSISKPNIMPLFVSALNLFDYENPEHVQGVSDWILYKTDILSKMQNPDHLVRGLPGLISQGWRKTIAGGEKADERNQKIANYIQQALRANGFDGFMVRENQAGEKSYAVYKPTQLKSVTGNDGSFDGELKDVRYSLSKIRYSDDRFERLLNSSTTTNNGEEKTAKKYLAFIDPLDFVRATSNLEKYYSLQNELEPVDFVKMRELGPITLMVGVDKDGEWKIKGHEGRHRMLALNNAGYRDVPVVLDFESNVKNTKPIKGKFLLSQDADSVARSVLVTDVEPLSIDNTDQAKAKFTRLDSKPTKYSLPQISSGAEARINATTTLREEKGFVERMLGVLKPENYSMYRQQFLNRYNQLSVADRAVAKSMGGVALLAEQSAEHAALMSDMSAGVTASAFGVGGRSGGVPIIKNGLTTIDTNQKGLLEILQPLAKYNDPNAYRYFQFYSAVKRGARLFQEGRERLIQPGDVAFAQELAQKFPEFEQIRKDWVEYNNALIKYQKDAGVLSAQDAIEYTKYYDYIPFFRQLDGEQTIGPNIYQSISGVKKPKKLKGGEAPLADFLETVVRNSQSAIAAGMKNIAAQRARDVGMQANIVQAIQPGTTVSDLEKIKVLENGVLKEYQCGDKLFVDAVKSLHMPDIPFMGLLSAPSTLLREAVTRDPGFILANLMRDSLSAYATSGRSITPVLDTVKNFGKGLTRKSPGFEALMNAGVIGGYEFSENVEQSGRTVAKELAKRAGYKGPVALRPFTSLWDGLEKATTASDAATRIAVYDRVLQETGSENEAIRAAWEIMNFNRKGSSPIIRVLTAAVPFLNARLQGLDVFYRAATGKVNNPDAKLIQRRFFARASMMMATSFLYAAAVAGNPDYEDQEEETKDNNWIIPGLRIKIPIPFEVGTLFKTIPERIYRYSFGNDTGQDLRDALWRATLSTLPINPVGYVPQVFKPMIEAMTNYNMFTGREIVGQGMKDVAPEFQVGPGTSSISEFIGKTLGLSPLKIDHVIKGYTGTMGMYAIDLMDSIMNLYGDSPKANKRFEQMPVIKRFAVDPEARGSVTAYYKLKDEVDTVVRTVNLLEKSMKPDEFAKYLEENMGLLAFKDYVRDMEKDMKEFREMRKMVASSPMSGADKRDALSAISQAEINLTANIQQVKKTISEAR